MSTGRVVLVVDDDETYRSTLSRAFERRGYRVLGAGSASEALELVAHQAVDYASVDLRMPGGSGVELVRALRLRVPSAVIVVLTGYGSIATALEAVKAGAASYLTKPADISELLAAFEAPVSSDAAAGAAPSALADGEGGEGVGAVAPEPALEVPSLARVEWEHINRVLSECGGNISKAARLLGLQRRSLQRKLAKYPVRR